MKILVAVLMMGVGLGIEYYDPDNGFLLFAGAALALAGLVLMWAA